MSDKKNIFEILNDNFFNPLTSKNKKIFIDCIMEIYQLYKNETSYQIEKSIVINKVQSYFENMNYDLTFEEDDTIYKDAREKANKIINTLKKCGWLEEEPARDHIFHIQLNDNAIPIIESFSKIMESEETEYQGVIYRINLVLQNIEKTQKPYEEIIIGVHDNIKSLSSELKRLNSSIKRKIDKLSKKLKPEEIIAEFYEYNSKIVSNAYYRLKTSDNISRYRNTIIKNLRKIIDDDAILQRATQGYIEINKDRVEEVTTEEAEEVIYNNVNELCFDMDNLDDIIKSIDDRNALYINNAVSRAKFMLTSGNNVEDKINEILKDIVSSINNGETTDDTEEIIKINKLFSIYPQNYISNESLHTIPIIRELDEIQSIDNGTEITEEEKQRYIEELRAQTNVYYSQRNVNKYLLNLFGDKERITIDDIPILDLKDFIRIIYIYIYDFDPSNCYEIEHSDKRITKAGHKLNYFELIRRHN